MNATDRIAHLRATTPPATCPRTVDGEHRWQAALSPNPSYCAACNIHQPTADIALLLAAIDWRDADRDRWAGVHELVERAIDKCSTSIDVIDLTDALKTGDSA